MIAKINGTIKENKNLFDKDRPTNPDAAREYFLNMRKDNKGETYFDKYVEYKDFFKDKQSIVGIVKQLIQEVQRSNASR